MGHQGQTVAVLAQVKPDSLVLVIQVGPSTPFAQGVLIVQIEREPIGLRVCRVGGEAYTKAEQKFFHTVPLGIILPSQAGKDFTTTSILRSVQRNSNPYYKGENRFVLTDES